MKTATCKQTFFIDMFEKIHVPLTKDKEYEILNIMQNTLGITTHLLVKDDDGIVSFYPTFVFYEFDDKGLRNDNWEIG